MQDLFHARASSVGAWLRGWLLRVAVVYWVAYCAEITLGEIRVPGLDALGDAASWLTNHLAVWVGHHVLGIAGPIGTESNGSGDRLINWIDLLVHAAIALVAGTLWAVLDRRRAHDARWRAMLRVALRYGLGFGMLIYGLEKLCALQFPAPSDGQLIQRWGDSSPMNVLWTFIGSSTAYEIFTGAAELVGAILVLFRRTALLGALVLAAVLINVVMLNLCYDVCVKLYSMHLLAMSVLVMQPDVGRLLDLLVYRRAVAAPPPPPVIASRRGRIARACVKWTMISLVYGSTIWWIGRAFFRIQDSPMAQHWAAGSWRVTSFARDGHAVAADDGARWDRLRFVPRGDHLRLRWRTTDAEFGPVYDVTFDEPAHALQLVEHEPDPAQPAPAKITLHAEHDPAHVTLRGEIAGHVVDVVLEKIVTDHMLLRTRGFHWVNEEPFNR